MFNWLMNNGAAFGFSKTVPSEDWHWEWWGGGPGGGICDITSPPAGNVDAATCEAIGGWAQDPDAPDATIAVEVWFDGAPGEPQAIAIPVVADQEREDLCAALGSCNHAFEVELPLGLRDGLPHAVQVVAIDPEGEENTTLVVNPPTLSCPAPALPPGVRRLLPDAQTFASWQFSELWDLAHVDAAALEQLEEGPELGVAPFLVTDADGIATWLVDKGFLRPIPDDDVAAAWRFDLAEVTVLDDAQLEEIPEGTPVRAKPMLATTDGVTMWLIDDAQDEASAGDAGGDGSGNDGGADDDGNGADDGSDDDGSGDAGLPGMGGDMADDGGCACRADASRERDAVWLFVLVGVGVFGRRRGLALRST